MRIFDPHIHMVSRITDDYERNRQAGIRGGFYIRFAGALTSRSSTSSGKKPALRLHDNRVDQPAGRALTVFAFGPVSCANNHLNSEFTGEFQILDAAVGAVLIMNLGGIHRILARTVGDVIDRDGTLAAAADLSLPGGETLIDDNYVRVGAANRCYAGKGNGTFVDASKAVGLSERVFNTRALAAVDVNGDGVVDLVLNNEGQDSVVLIGK